MADEKTVDSAAKVAMPDATAVAEVAKPDDARPEDIAAEQMGEQAPLAAANQAEVKSVEWLTARINQIEASNNDNWRDDLVGMLAEDGLCQERTVLGIRLVLDGLEVTSGPVLSDALAAWCQVARLAILNEGVA